jgi:3-oxoacyl-[acyl-carrier protein] reductase
VAPGWVETDMTVSAIRNTMGNAEILKSIPRKLIAKPHEIAGPVLFLASDLAENIVGEILNVNGGSVMCG